MTIRLPTAELTFDQLKTGDRFSLGTQRITREEVIEFASKYDPQPFHLDDAAAAASPIFERLSASGWHSVMIMNLMLDRLWKGTSVRGLAGGGVDEIRWAAPVYPDDVLAGTLELVSIRQSTSRPERSIMTMRTTLRTQDERDVVTMVITGIFANQ